MAIYAKVESGEGIGRGPQPVEFAVKDRADAKKQRRVVGDDQRQAGEALGQAGFGRSWGL